MVKHIIYLEYGSTVLTIGSGPGAYPNLRRYKLTHCVNSSSEGLTVGSVCSACVEATIFDSKKRIRKGQVFNVLEIDDQGNATLVGRFKIKTADRTGNCIYKIVAYDAIAELDKNLVSWLLRFDFSKNYTLVQFAEAVCAECGVTFVSGGFPNCDFIVGEPIYDKEATGRKLLHWCAEIAGRFCRATADGNICFDWYDNGMSHTLMPSGDFYYFGGTLRYGEYDYLPIDAVVIERLDGTLWPEKWGANEAAYTNPLIIKGNMLLIAYPDDEHRLAALQNIKDELDRLPQYRSCKVACPASRSINPGDTIGVTDALGFRFHSLVMNKVCEGQRITLECY